MRSDTLQTPTDTRATYAHCNLGAGLAQLFGYRGTLTLPPRGHPPRSVRGLPAERFLEGSGLRHQGVELVLAPCAEHFAALLGRHEPAVAEHPLHQRRRRYGKHVRYLALRVPREQGSVSPTSSARVVSCGRTPRSTAWHGQYRRPTDAFSIGQGTASHFQKSGSEAEVVAQRCQRR